MKTVLALLALSVASIAVADDGWWAEAGGVGSFGKNHPTIRMVSEDLKITLGPEKAKVDVLFVFRNEGKATRVKMAFPENYQNRMGSSLDTFRTWVDGRLTTARRRVIEKADPSEADNINRAVWLKEVDFAANQTRKVRVTYNSWYSGNTSGDTSLGYVLMTGASWKGPIGECAITVDWKAIKGWSAPFLTPGPSKWKFIGPRRQQLVLRDWEPNQDLAILMCQGFWNFSLNGVPLSPEWSHGTQGRPYSVGKPTDPMVRAEAFDSFFSAWDKKEDWAASWKNPIVAKFGGPFTISQGVLTTASGRKIRLPRGFKHVKGEPNFGNDGEFVYLKDVVEALGGTMDYLPSEERVSIRF